MSFHQVSRFFYFFESHESLNSSICIYSDGLWDFLSPTDCLNLLTPQLGVGRTETDLSSETNLFHICSHQPRPACDPSMLLSNSPRKKNRTEIIATNEKSNIISSQYQNFDESCHHRPYIKNRRLYLPNNPSGMLMYSSTDPSSEKNNWESKSQSSSILLRKCVERAAVNAGMSVTDFLNVSLGTTRRSLLDDITIITVVLTPSQGR